MSAATWAVSGAEAALLAAAALPPPGGESSRRLIGGAPKARSGGGQPPDKPRLPLPAAGRVVGRPRCHLSWTPAHDALLGQAPDCDLAAVWGLRHQPVWRRRCQLGIPPFGSTRGRIIIWTPDMVRDLGVMSDRAVARRHGLSVPTVALKRQSLGIPDGQRRIAWDGATDAVLGRGDDATVAAWIGVCRNTVVQRRRRLGIQPCRQSGRRIGP